MDKDIKTILYEIDITIDGQYFSLKSLELEDDAPTDLSIIQKDFDSCLKNIDLVDPEYKVIDFITSYDIVINDSEVTYYNDSDESDEYLRMLIKENNLIKRILNYKVTLEMDARTLNEFMIYLKDSEYFETPKKKIWLENDKDYRDMIIGGLIFFLTNGTSDAPEKSSIFAPDYASNIEEGFHPTGHEGFSVNEKLS